MRGELDSELTAEIQQALINIDETEEGKELLDDLYKADGFTPADGERYEVVRRTFEKMEDYIEF